MGTQELGLEVVVRKLVACLGWDEVAVVMLGASNGLQTPNPETRTWPKGGKGDFETNSLLT